MNLKQLTIKERERMPKRIPKKLRIKIGRVLMVYASLPLLSAWAYVIAIPMSMAISPTLWAKDKIRELKINLWSLK